MKKKEFLTEAKRKAIIADKEKAIIESFVKTFNKIKRIDENEISEAVTAEDKLNELIGKPISLIRTLHTRGKYNPETGERPKVTEDKQIDGVIGEIVDERAAKGLKVMNSQGGKIAFLMYDKHSGSFIEGDSTFKYTYKGADETSERILQFILRYLVGVNENELDMGEIGREHRGAESGINPYQEQPELSDLGQLTPYQEEMKGYISKYVNSELELNHEMSNYINLGYQGLSDTVKQGLSNDMDYQTLVQMSHDEETFRRERGGIDENEGNLDDNNNIKKILTDIQLQNPNDRNKNFVIDKLLDDKQYPFQYGGNGKQLGTHNMTWLELSKLAYEVLFRKGVENWGENNWKTMSDFIIMKINQNK